jgi:polyhydroxybutyrate depolymerase
MPGRGGHQPRRAVPLRRSGLTWLVLACIVAVLAAACGGKGRALSVPATTGGSGCGAAFSSGSSKLAMTMGGQIRIVIVHIPSGYTGSRKLALVLNMHGSGSTAAAQEAFTGMDVTADAHHFIVAYPQALISEGTGFDWNVPREPLLGGKAVPRGAGSDVTFLTSLVAILEHRYCVDPARVYATGFSGGARMASQLACDASTTFAAVAAVSGLRKPSPCPTARAVPVIALHGTADPIDPYGGGGQPYWTYSVPQAALAWAKQDSCSLAATPRAERGFTLTQFRRCADRSSVELYSINGEGHEWPGGPPMPGSLTSLLGPQSNSLNADSTIWAFFSAHPMP